jgi:hypothetical protein
MGFLKGLAVRTVKVSVVMAEHGLERLNAALSSLLKTIITAQIQIQEKAIP